jgi:hypothetical protein
MMATAARRLVTDHVATGGNNDDDGNGATGDGAMGYDNDNNDDNDNADNRQQRRRRLDR